MSSLDLLSGYWQLSMAPESREVAAFSTPNGHFEWTRMPFGLKGAPLTFQRTMNNIFGDMLGNSVYIYLDDIPHGDFKVGAETVTRGRPKIEIHQM